MEEIGRHVMNWLSSSFADGSAHESTHDSDGIMTNANRSNFEHGTMMKGQREILRFSKLIDYVYILDSLQRTRTAGSWMEKSRRTADAQTKTKRKKISKKVGNIRGESDGSIQGVLCNLNYPSFRRTRPWHLKYNPFQPEFALNETWNGFHHSWFWFFQ
jgi:hypothetical protein